MRRLIKVLIAGTESIFINNIEKEIKNDESFELAGVVTSYNGFIPSAVKNNPHVVIVENKLDTMRTHESIKELFEKTGTPSVVICEHGANILKIDNNIGILDVIVKPKGTSAGDMSGFIKELVVKAKIASAGKKQVTQSTMKIEKTERVIAIGASTGGVEAISSFIHTIPKQTPGIVIVQHIPPNFSRMFAERLNAICQIKVHEAQDGEVIEPGKALIAPGELQMRVYKKDGRHYVRVAKGSRVNGHCPSVDVLFHSVAEVFGQNAMGVILTGMGNDGAKGLLEMKKRGAYTVGQNKDSSIVYGMPKEAFDMGAVIKQVPLTQVADEMKKYMQKYGYI